MQLNNVAEQHRFVRVVGQNFIGLYGACVEAVRLWLMPLDIIGGIEMILCKLSKTFKIPIFHPSAKFCFLVCPTFNLCLNACRCRLYFFTFAVIGICVIRGWTHPRYFINWSKEMVSHSAVSDISSNLLMLSVLWRLIKKTLEYDITSTNVNTILQ